MTALPENVSQAWEGHEGPIVFGTVDSQCTPNLVYMTCVRKIAEDRFVLVDNFFNKTRANIASGSEGAFVFITAEGKSFQIKGRLERLTSGPIYDDMKTWNPERLPGEAAVVLHVQEVYSGAEKLA